MPRALSSTPKAVPERLNDRATYMLRRVLCPWKRDEVIDETLDFCRESRVDEIMWFTESSGMYKELLPLAAVERIVEDLRVARARTEAAGLVYSINPLTTLGHGDYGTDGARVHPGMEFMVNYDGARAKFCPCPLSPVWRDLISRTYAMYAATRPRRLWLEDDFRYANHGPAVTFGCYCDRHVAEFGRRIGRALTREELVAAILRPGKPDPLRPAWLDFLEWTLADAAAMVARAVHKASPDTQLSWMSSTPAMHELEGRNPGTQIGACAGGGMAGIRLCTTHYHEDSPRDMLVQDEALKKVIVHLPGNVVRCTEIESMPHSIYTKSFERIGAQIAWGCVVNAPNSTLNIFDFLGTPTNVTPIFKERLRERKDFYDALARAFASTPTQCGIGIPSHPKSSHFVWTAEGRHPTEWMVREGGWVDPLRAFGMPIIYSRNEPVTAVTGQALRTFSEEELRTLFTRGVLLDLSALRVLQELGRGDYAGVVCNGIIPFRTRNTGPEELTEPDFGGGPRRYVWTYGMPVGVLEPQPTARPISRVVDSDGRFMAHGIVLFENPLGGRVCTVPYDCAGTDPDTYKKGPSSFFYSESRKTQMRRIIAWLGRGLPPLTVEANGWTLPHRADGAGRVALAAMNINYDAWPRVEFVCAFDAAPRRVSWLKPDGKWKSLSKGAWAHSAGALRIRVEAEAPTHGVAAVLIETAS